MYSELVNDETEIFVTVYIDGYYYQDYMVSNKGRIYSLKTNSFMEGAKHHGYIRIKLRDENGKTILKHKHRIVAESFCDNPDNKPLVTWRAHANLLYSNWINYYVYQETPFDINDIK